MTVWNSLDTHKRLA